MPVIRFQRLALAAALALVWTAGAGALTKPKRVAKKPTPAVNKPANAVNTPTSAAAKQTPPPDATLAMRMYGAGPVGADNAMKQACTGSRDAGAQVLCVRAGAGGGSGTAAAPFATIGAAVAGARDGDVIQVAQGEYRESVRVGNFGPGDCDNGGEAGRNYVFLGGFRNDFEARDARQYASTVTGNSGIAAFVICVTGGRSIVDGFALNTGHKARGFVGVAGSFGGGAGTLTMSHNVVSGNRPAGKIQDDTFGGGIAVSVLSGATVEITDNQVRDNESGRGAGIATDTKSETKPIGTMKLLRNLVERNISDGSHGGGMHISGNAEIAYNVVRENKVLGQLGGGGWGGGFIADGGRPVVAHHNVVIGNTAAAYGSGEFYDSDVDARVSFELVANNGCSDDARNSEILVDIGDKADSTADFSNITVIGHRCPNMTLGALVVEQGAHAKVHKSVFWNNIGASGKPFDFGVAEVGTIGVDSTVTQQGKTGPDNVTADPGFLDASGGDYRSKAFPTRGAFAEGGLGTSS